MAKRSGLAGLGFVHDKGLGLVIYGGSAEARGGRRRDRACRPKRVLASETVDPRTHGGLSSRGTDGAADVLPQRQLHQKHSATQLFAVPQHEQIAASFFDNFIQRRTAGTLCRSGRVLRLVPAKLAEGVWLLRVALHATMCG